MWSWRWILFVACFLFAGYVVRWLFLSLFARFLGIQEVKIQTLHALGLGGVSNVEWEGNEVTWDNAQDRQELLQRSVVTVKRIKPHTDKDIAANKRFIGILVEGVTIKVPKAHLAHQLEKLESKKKRSQRHGQDPRSRHSSFDHSEEDGFGAAPSDESTTSGRATAAAAADHPTSAAAAAGKETRWQLTRRLVGRGALLTFRWLRSLIFRRLLFGVRFIDVQITVEEVCQLDLNLSLGVQHVDTVRCLNAPIEAYLAVSELTLSESPSAASDGDKSAAPPAPVLQLPRSLWFSVRTSDLHKVSLWNVCRRRIGPRSFRLDLKFPHHELLHGSEDKSEKAHAAPRTADLFLQLDKALTLAELVQAELRKARPKSSRPRGSSQDHPESQQARDRSATSPKGKLSPMHYINAVFARLPLIECQYAPPQLEDQLVLRTRISNIKLAASLGEVFQRGSRESQVPGLESGHRRWLGSTDTIPIALQTHWDSWTWDLQTKPQRSGSSGASVAELVTSQLRVGQLKVAMTSNFAPWHRVDALQERIICEARLKSSFLDLRQETVDHLVQQLAPILSARANRARQHDSVQLGRPKQKNATGNVPARLWPCFVTQVDIDECSFRLLGPDSSSDDASPGWTSAQQLRLKTPAISISSQTEYRFISAPLTQRRLQEAKEVEDQQKRNQQRRERGRATQTQTTSHSSVTRYSQDHASEKAGSLFKLALPSQSTFEPAMSSLKDEVAFDPHYSATYDLFLALSTSHPVEIAIETLTDENYSAATTASPRTPKEGLNYDPFSTTHTQHFETNQLISVGPFSVESKLATPLRDDGVLFTLEPVSTSIESDVSLGRLEISLWQPSVLSLLSHFSDLLAAAPSPKPRTTSEPSTSPDHGQPRSVHPMLRYFSRASARCHVDSIAFEACGYDALRDPDISRGLALLVRDLQLCADGVRQWSSDIPAPQARADLGLPSGYWSSAGQKCTAHAGDGLAATELRFSRLTIKPILDAAAVDREGGPHTKDTDDLPAFTSQSDFLDTQSGSQPPEDWEYLGRSSFAPNPDKRTSRKKVTDVDTRVLTVASTSISTSLHYIANAASESTSSASTTVTHTSVKSSTVALSFKLFHVYCCLASASAFKHIIEVCKKHSGSSEPKSSQESPKQLEHGKNSATQATWSLELPSLFIHLTFDPAVELHFQAKNIAARGPDTLVAFDHLHAASPSPTAIGQWNTLLQLQDCHLRIPKLPTHLRQDPLVKLSGHSLRLRIPYKYQLWQLVDSAVSNVKACKQIFHNLILGHAASVLEPHAEAPKHLPRIECAMREVVLEAEDDPMENRLNLARRVGAVEARMRQERSAALDARDHQYDHLDPEDAGNLFRAAQDQLRKFDAAEWIRRFRNALAEQSKREQLLLQKLQGRYGPEIADSPLPLTHSNRECPLARAVFTGFNLQLRAPSFLLSENGVKDYLQEVGGMPQDRSFCLLVPLHLKWTVSDAKIALRDYPLPLLHLPKASTARRDQRPAWEFESDVVIAEQVPAADAIRKTVQEVVPPTSSRPGHDIMVPRSGMPTQSYGRPHIHLASEHHVTIGWGNSIQPALSDVARVVDSLSKPSPDPSPRIGFWDKLPLVVHGSLTVVSDADLHLHLKGSRDPYSLNGSAAGFVKIWQGNVKLLLNHDNADRELLQILSDKYILAVPDLEHYDDAAAAGLDFGGDSDSEDFTTRYEDRTQSKSPAPDVKIDKTLGVLVNGVRWGMGFRCERTCARGQCSRDEPCEGNKFQRKCRFFDFKPHYDVKTRIDPGPKDEWGKIRDSFAEYRSDFVHFSLSLVSPIPDRLPPSGQLDRATNGLRLAPLMDQHFWRWWSLFDSSLSLPVRTGKVFHSPAPAPKFGRATATLKYRFDVQPFFGVHTYRQEAAVDWLLGKTTVLGMKIRFDALKIDLHQRTEEFTLQRKELGSKRVYHKKFYRAEVHGHDVDARLVAARFNNPIKSIVAEASGFIDTASAALDDTGRETSWIDSIPSLSHRERAQWENYEDFTDLGPNSLGDDELIKIVPLMASPACTYDMQPVPLMSSHQSNLGRPPPRDSAPRSSKFGYEGSHTCLVGGAPKPMAVQIRTVDSRLQVLKDLLKKDDGALLPGVAHTRKNELERRVKVLEKLREHFDAVARRARDHQGRPTGEGLETLFGHTSGQDDPDFAAALLEDQDNYSQKLRLHQPNIQVNTVSRDVLLKYWDSSRARKGLSYQLSASVLAQMRKIETEVKMRAPASPSQPTEDTAGRPSQAIDHAVDACHSISWADIAAKQYEQPDGPEPPNGKGNKTDTNNNPSGGHRAPSRDAPDGVNPNWAVESQFLAIFGAPQFHIKSDSDEGSEAVLTTQVAVFRTFAVSDPETEDDINATVLHRNYGELRMVQIFYPQRDRVRALYGDTATTFVPLEVLHDGTLRYECDCMVGSTHLSMRYDKFNRLRMTNVGHAHFESGAPEAFHQGRDEITISVGQFEMAATHHQFAAMMHIFQKLTLYTNPDRKRKNERLETARLTADYSDPKLVVRWIEEKQKTIRRLFDVLSRSDPKTGDLDFYSSQAEALHHSEELNTFLQAMQEAHEQHGGERKARKGDLSIRAKSSQIVLSMLQADHLPFVKAAIKNIGFNWRSQEDGSVSNQLVIGSISANNYLADSQFLEILYPIDDATLEKDFPLKGKKVVLAAMWSVLPPIGGVSVVEDLQLYLHPINLLLERRVGHMCWDYFFNAKGEVTKTAEREKSRNQSRLPHSARSSDNLNVSGFNGSGSLHSNGSSTSSLAKASQSSSSLAVPGNGGGSASGRSLRRAKSQESIANKASNQGWDDDIGSGLTHADVQSMRERARTYRTFLRVDVPDTLIFLTYKHYTDKGSWKDMFGLEFKTPHFSYNNRAWSWQELAGALKKDAKTHLLAQTGTLINQAFTKARNPKNMPTPASVIKKLRNGIRTGEVIHEDDEEHLAMSRQVSPESRAPSLNGTPSKPLTLSTSSSSQGQKSTATSSRGPVPAEDENGAAVETSTLDVNVSSPVHRTKSEKRKYAIKSMQMADAAMERGYVSSESEGDEEASPRGDSPQEASQLFSDELHRSDDVLQHHKESKRERLLHKLPKLARKSLGSNHHSSSHS